MSQPQWKLIANLGDADPIEHGGFFVYRDDTGVYTEEAEILIPDEESEYSESSHWTAYRFPLDRCTFQGGILSDNPYHPDYPVWFATPEERKADRPQDSTYLSNVARFAGMDLDELRADFCSADPIRRAQACRLVGEYHGWENFDEYPLTFTDRTEVESRYRDNDNGESVE